MDDMRKSLSKLKKDFKHRVGGKKHALGRAEADTAGEEVSSSASLLRPGPRIAVSGHDGEGARINADVSQVYSRDPSPHPEFVPADEGRLDGPQRKEADVNEKESNQKDLRLDLDVEVVAGSGSSHEAEQASSPPPVAPISPKQEPDSTWMLSPQALCLTIPLDAGTPVICDHPPQEVLPDNSPEPGASVNEKKSGWKSTAFATTKLLLRGVRDSADAFGPLKSVAGGLCFILENCEVWSLPTYVINVLIGTAANEGKRANNRIVGTPGEGAC